MDVSTKVADFSGLALRIASPDDINTWSHGEVLKPETINYRTQRPEKDGLFCERIFGPEKDWECYCGKYKRIRYKGIICDKCGVEVTRSSVRRERFGHISLAVPVAHIWFLRGVPSRIGMALDLSVQQLERVIYFNGYIITKIYPEAREAVLNSIENEMKQRTRDAKTKQSKSAVKSAYDKAKAEVGRLVKFQVLSEIEYFDLSLRYAEVFEAGSGAEVIRKLMVELDLSEVSKEINKKVENSLGLVRRKYLRQLRFYRGLMKARMRPEWMILTDLPVLPPDLRPMVQLDGGRYATSDLNDLYRRVINRNNRLKHLQEINAPEVIQRNEKRMLQEAVDALIDNSIRKGHGAQAAALRRPLKSLADMLKGKQGRFRQNLLGKRVDYSGRSVIVVGPQLALDECGIPKKMALELFKPFVIAVLLRDEVVFNIRGASRLIEETPDVVWAALEEVIQGKYVLLNRAPTLHRLGIQAFKPILIEGEAIQIHPLVCPAFNADFDGDQMAVHVPLGQEAQWEAHELMRASRNLLKPANGAPIAVPRHDIVLGSYWATRMVEGSKGEGKYFSDIDEAKLAIEFGYIEMNSKIFLPISKPVIEDVVSGFNELSSGTKPTRKTGQEEVKYIETTIGRAIFNEQLPEAFPYVNTILNARALEKITAEIFLRYDIKTSAEILDAIKDFGFEYSTKSGITFGMDDLKVPEEKPEILEKAHKEVEVIEDQYQQGLLIDQERRIRIIEIWTRVKNDLAKMIPKTLDPTGSLFAIVDSGSRGSWSQPTQMAGMKGLVINPAGQIMELPITSSFKEGFNVLEYFISTHGARKGASNTALRTATAGYLTRRLIDVAQEIIVSEYDCKSAKGISLYRKDSEETGQNFASRLLGRTLIADVEIGNKILIKKNEIMNNLVAQQIALYDIDEIVVRSATTCKTVRGICQLCYGWDLGRNELVALGDAVGIIAAQAIGEPGTQLTMRTFHTGGVAGGGDITQGLPRVEEIFEARPPKGEAILAEAEGLVKEIVEDQGERVIVIEHAVNKSKSSGKTSSSKTSKTKKEKKSYRISRGRPIIVSPGQKVDAGAPLTEGSINLKELFRFAGTQETQRRIIKEVQRIYVTEGVNINDKHIEIIVRQMFARVRIKEEEDTEFTPGEIVEKSRFEQENKRFRDMGKKPAIAHQMLLGITKSSLTTESFLAAASFQETSRVLIRAAVDGLVDNLRGLKENVIIGKLIPAGTGYRKDFVSREAEEGIIKVEEAVQ